MKTRILLPLLACLLCPLFSPLAMADRQYVSDVVFVPVRSGAGNQYRIVHSGIRSGTPLTVIDAPEGVEWIHVRTDGGIEGWIPSQYLTATPTARIQLTRAQAELAKATQRAEALQEQLNELTADHRELSATAERQIKERDQFSEELRELKVLSANAIDLDKRYQALLEQYDMTQTEADTLQAENHRIKSDKTVNQWLFGAGLLILGMVLMLILPALKSNKRQTDWAN